MNLKKKISLLFTILLLPVFLCSCGKKENPIISFEIPIGNQSVNTTIINYGPSEVHRGEHDTAEVKDSYIAVYKGKNENKNSVLFVHFHVNYDDILSEYGPWELSNPSYALVEKQSRVIIKQDINDVITYEIVHFDGSDTIRGWTYTLK